MIALRKTRSGHAAAGKPKVRFNEKAQWLRFEYAGMLAVFNFASVPRRISLPAGDWVLALDSQAGGPGELPAQAELPPQGTRVFRRRRASI